MTPRSVDLSRVRGRLTIAAEALRVARTLIQEAGEVRELHALARTVEKVKDVAEAYLDVLTDVVAKVRAAPQVGDLAEASPHLVFGLAALSSAVGELREGARLTFRATWTTGDVAEPLQEEQPPPTRALPRPSRADVLAFLHDARAMTEARDLDEPHGVILTDPETGSVQVYGPYPDAYAAASAAGAWQRYHDRVTGPPSMKVTIVMHLDASVPPEV